MKTKPTNMNVRQIETLRYLQSRDDLNTAKALGLEEVTIDTDGMAWSYHNGMDLCCNKTLGGWLVVRDLVREPVPGTALHDAVDRADSYAKDDYGMTGVEKLIRALTKV